MLDTFAKNLTQSLARFANAPANNALYHVIHDLVIAQDNGQDSIAVSESVLADLRADFPSLFADAEVQSETSRDTSLDAPLVVIGNFISTRRAEYNAKRIAAFFRKQTDPAELSAQAFADIPEHLDIWQKVAIFACVYNRVTVITGGAGTGKTTTLMHAVQALLNNTAATTIMLTAPTGKAVKRLQQALSQHQLEISCKTLHQQLGMREDTTTPYFHGKRQLDCDVLVIDEASMVGQDLFSFVIDALPRGAKLILLGDDNQLPPVNATPIFHPIVRQSFGFSEKLKHQFSECFNEAFPDNASDVFSTHHENHAAMIDHHVKLQKTFRFGDTISVLAHAVLQSDLTSLLAQRAVKQPKNIADAVIEHIESNISVDGNQSVSEQLTTHALPIVLCVTRQGDTGTDAINATLDILFRQKLNTSQTWYRGRKVLIEKNDYALGVFNGDIGVYIGAGDVQFDGERRLRVEQLPSHSLAFAITVHKSQGSEYDNVLIAFSAFTDELVSKDMLYTAITRAKQQVTIFTDTVTLEKALQKQPQRHSRVNDLLK